jgi:hypothetical protein
MPGTLLAATSVDLFDIDQKFVNRLFSSAISLT